MPLVLFISYAGMLGGAERVLVQFAGALEGETCIACPPGPLADAAHAAGLRVLPLRLRPLELRASVRDRVLAPLRLASHRFDALSLVRNLEPDLLVAWGARTALALTGVRSCPVVFEHHEFVPGPLIGALV